VWILSQFKTPGTTRPGTPVIETSQRPTMRKSPAVNTVDRLKQSWPAPPLGPTGEAARFHIPFAVGLGRTRLAEAMALAAREGEGSGPRQPPRVAVAESARGALSVFGRCAHQGRVPSLLRGFSRQPVNLKYTYAQRRADAPFFASRTAIPSNRWERRGPSGLRSRFCCAAIPDWAKAGEAIQHFPDSFR